MGNYRKLEVWRRAHELTVALYQATSTFPKQEQFGLVAQLRDAADQMEANLTTIRRMLARPIQSLVSRPTNSR